MKKYRISTFAIISFTVFVLSGAMLLASRLSTALADSINEHISSPFRRFMAGFADHFSFSLFEILVLSLPLVAALIIWRAVVVFRRGYGRTRFIVNVIAVALLLYSGNSIALGVSYNTTSVAQHLALEETEINEQTLSVAMTNLCHEINALSEEITYFDGESHSGYDMSELSTLICDSYAAVASQYSYPDSFYSTAKGVDALHFLSYLRLTGIYTYYTGEANVNTDFPDYDVTFTTAHELSHQRGVLREDEANFMAYLVCSESTDPYLRYSAALSMLDYVGTALWRTNPQLYYSILDTLSESARDDLRASYRVGAEYGDTVFADISNFVNDLFLRSNGTDGVVTYGRVVRLYMSYRSK